MNTNNVHKVKMNKIDKEILDNAAAALKAETGRELLVKREQQVKRGGEHIDAVVTLEGTEYNAEVKRWVQQANLGALMYQLEKLPGRALLVGDYVNRKLAKRLKDAGIQFIDAAGNAYIDQDNLYLNVQGNGPLATLTTGEHREPPTTMPLGPGVKPMQQGGTGRAFTPTGLKVLYELIMTPELIGEPYRVIAQRADVALGTVGWVINDLKARGFVLNHGKHKQLKATGKLVEDWVEAYPLRLRTKQVVGRFVADDGHWWQHFDLAPHAAQWGGEVAAAKMTRYLKPKIATVYVRGDIRKFLQAARLIRRGHDDEQTNVEVLRPFWLQDEPGDTVTPLLVYADLIATADTRNIETARIIHDEYLGRYLKQT